MKPCTSGSGPEDERGVQARDLIPDAVDHPAQIARCVDRETQACGEDDSSGGRGQKRPAEKGSTDLHNLQIGSGLRSGCRPRLLGIPGPRERLRAPLAGGGR
jgi:hypothetical protein